MSKNNTKWTDRKATQRAAKEVRKFVLSGDGAHQLIDLKQMLEEAMDFNESMIGFNASAINAFQAKKGTVVIDKAEEGFYRATFSLNGAAWVQLFNEKGRCIRFTQDNDPEDLDTVNCLAEAMRAYYSLDKYMFVKEEMDKVKAYLENDNALRGMDTISKAVHDNAQLLVDLAMAVENEDDTVSVDFHSLLRDTGQGSNDS